MNTKQKQKTKKELIQILQKNNHPNSVHLDKFSKSQLHEMLEQSSLKQLPDVRLSDSIEHKDNVIQNISQILLPKTIEKKNS